jgi:hypothetical protein
MATKQPAALTTISPPVNGRAGCEGGRWAAPAPLEHLGNIDFAEFTRVNGAKPLQRVTLSDGGGVCLHRDGNRFAVEMHVHDENGGYLLSMSQAEAARIGKRLLTFAGLVPGQPPQGGSQTTPVESGK